MKILILCTGNSCRSQMAEGFLKAFNSEMKIYSAGTAPSDKVHPNAVYVMSELGVDISENYPQSVGEFTEESFDYVITVCGGAKESCPVFAGQVNNRLHIGFEDPAEVTGSKDFILGEFRRIRDEILRDFFAFYQKEVLKN
jgi:arsenate reductase